tara:strand:- start:299 stop:736 length:438 start_codon:yes stop_codon:yes gene_type:complete
MLFTPIVWIPILLITLSLASWWAYASYHQHKLNMSIASELSDVIAETIDNLGTAQQIKPPIETEDPLTTPGMLSTLVTVLVSKYGDTRLSMNDFMIPDEEYVSVYVDTTSQEILLSLKSGLADLDYADDDFSMIKFGKSDDNTFH